MKDLILISTLTALLLACGEQRTTSGSATADHQSPATSSVVFDESLSSDPCALLTPEMVASVAGVSVGEVEQLTMSSMCIYSWEGGKANIAFVRVFDDAEKAGVRFANAHKNMSGAEVKEAMQQIGEQAKRNLDQKAEAGEEVPDKNQVDTVVGGMGSSMGGGIQFEVVEGLGDQAAFDVTRHETKIGDQVLVSHANKLDVLIGNLSFTVSYSLDRGPEGSSISKDENVALARAVLAGLK